MNTCLHSFPSRVTNTDVICAGAVLGIFIRVGQSKAKHILGRPTGVVYVGIMGMTRAVWAGQERVVSRDFEVGSK